MYCKNCRIEVNEGATFCPKCGSANSLTDEKPAKPKMMNRKKILLIIGGVVSLIAIYCLVCLIIAISKWSYPNLHAKKLSADTDSSDFQIGDYLSFGEYQGEEIEWRVLDKDGDNLLVISEYGIDAKPYNTEDERVTWQKCSLRKWLNDDFLMGAFSTDESKRIRLSHIEAERNPEYDTDPGSDTLDYVFLLSINEAERYFSSNEDGMCRPTEGALDNGAFAIVESVGDMFRQVVFWEYDGWEEKADWWLRSPGDSRYSAANVCQNVSGYAHVSFSGDRVNNDSDCVRPALWINLGSNYVTEQPANPENTDYVKKLSANVESSDFQIGDYLSFGEYQGEEIEWRVLDKDGDYLLIISEYGIDAKPYNTEYEKVTWQKCSLRKWLNDDFLMGAFSTDESKRIRLSNVEAERNPEYDTDPGNDTLDYVFLLSIKEAEKYFKSDEDRICGPTEYALREGADISSSRSSHWWLRSPGDSSGSAVIVSSSGHVYYFGHYVIDDDNCVRPALWINLDS